MSTETATILASYLSSSTLSHTLIHNTQIHHPSIYLSPCNSTKCKQVRSTILSSPFSSAMYARPDQMQKGELRGSVRGIENKEANANRSSTSHLNPREERHATLECSMYVPWCCVVLSIRERIAIDDKTGTRRKKGVIGFICDRNILMRS
jgi:hypothetical protein